MAELTCGRVLIVQSNVTEIGALLGEIWEDLFGEDCFLYICW